MDSYEPSTWGDRHADVYEQQASHISPADTAAAVELLAGLAGDGPVLELGVGTGRVAIPLAERGLEVHGVEASARMLERLRARPGGERVRAVLGDLADPEPAGSFRLVYAVFNTFFELYTEADQRRCLENAAARLTRDGVLVLELYVPEPPAAGGSRIAVTGLEPERVTLVASRHDHETGTTDSVEIWLTEQGIRLFPLRERALAPEEVDRLAALAGLRLRDRWGGWRREPFGPESREHVSVYARA